MGKGAGGLFDDYGQSVATDAAGNVFVVGFFSSDTINFGTNSLVNIGVLPNVPDIFIVKYDATGNVVWAKKTGGIFGDRGYGIATDASGNVFVTGSYDSQIDFGSTVLNSGGSYNCMFIVKYDTAGNVLLTCPPSPISKKMALKINMLYSFFVNLTALKGQKCFILES